MKIDSLLGGARRSFSFEFYPPKTAEDTKLLYQVLKELQPLKPDFVSVTSSTASGARLQSVALAKLIKEHFALEPLTHLTCIMYSREDVSVIAGQLRESGLENILALRGDKNAGLVPGQDFQYANELVSQLRGLGGFCVGVAAYPEKHPEAPSAAADIEHLKSKVDAGADFAITQLFFDNDGYFSFVERCRAAGITVPIIPGIMPVTSYSQLQKFVKMCGVVIPPQMAADLEKISGDREAVSRYGMDFALKQCRGLLAGGAPGIHFYTLNKSASTRMILGELRRQYPSG